MKAGHSKLDGYSATLPAMRPSPRLPTVVAPLPPPSPCEKPHGLIPRPEHLRYRPPCSRFTQSPPQPAPAVRLTGTGIRGASLRRAASIAEGGLQTPSAASTVGATCGKDARCQLVRIAASGLIDDTRYPRQGVRCMRRTIRIFHAVGIAVVGDNKRNIACAQGRLHEAWQNRHPLFRRL
jgi:hypothetical protein